MSTTNGYEPDSDLPSDDLGSPRHRRAWGSPTARVNQKVLIGGLAVAAVTAAVAVGFVVTLREEPEKLIYTFVSPERPATDGQQTDGTSWFTVDDSWRLDWAVTAQGAECMVDLYVVDKASQGAKRLDEFHGIAQNSVSFDTAGTYSVSVVHRCEGDTPSTVEIRVWD